MKNFLIKLGIAVGSILLVIFFLQFFLSWYTNHGEKNPVPDFTGLSFEEAERIAEDHDLRISIRDSVYDEKKPKNAVTEQDPEAGSFVKSNRMVYLRMNSLPTPLIEMPDLANPDKVLTLRQATATLEALGLTLGKVIERPDIAENAVLEQRYEGKIIEAGTKIKKGSTIDLVIGTGFEMDESVGVPDLVGLTLEEAQILMESSGLKIGSMIFSGKINDSASCVVTKQMPEYKADAIIRKGSSINISLKP